jgi:hypothetical protein
MKKSLKGVITGAALATIVAASAIGYCATREELPRTTPIGYNIDAKQIDGNVDLDGLTTYIRNNHSENWNNFADMLDSGEYASLSLMPMPKGGEYSAQLMALNADSRGQAVILTEKETREVLRYFRDFEEGPGRTKYVQSAIIRGIVENNGDFPGNLERVLGEGNVVNNSCGSDPIAKLIKHDNASIYFNQEETVSIVTGDCSLTAALSESNMDNLVNTLESSFK